MDTPVVSIIMATYNRSHLIERAVGAILNQTYQDFELIIVDDGSTDNTEEIVNNMKSEKIRFIKLGKNSGAPVARNLGLHEARGKYVEYQDSDDECLPEHIEEHVKVLNAAPPEVGAVYSGYWHVYPARKVYKPAALIHPKEGDIHANILRQNFVPIHAMVRKEIVEQVGGFDEKFPRFQDWDLWIRVSKITRFAFIDKPLKLEYLSSDSISMDTEKMIKAGDMIIQKYADEIKADPGIFSNHYYNYSINLSSGGRLKDARNYILKAIKISPLNLKYYAFFCVTIFGQGFYNFVRRIREKVVKSNA